MANKHRGISYVAGLKWGSAYSKIRLEFKRRQSFRAVICYLVPDFASHSPFGSGEWYLLWRLR